MKIKTLAIAAATLAVGAITSQAQVYSQNIVGYVNQAFPPSKYVLVTTPMDTGNNVITNIIQGVPGGSLLQIWSGGGFNSYQYKGTPKHWINLLDNTTNDNYVLSPGVGYFLESGGVVGFTNTYSGQIVVNSGSAATNALTTGLQPVGSKVPFSDVITNGATVNLQVGGGTTIQIWNVGSQNYTSYQWKNAQHSFQNLSTLVYTNPVINVGQGFFISPNVATNWIQTSP